MVVIDLGDAVKYESHPEIAVRNAWTVKRLKDELSKIREMGLEQKHEKNIGLCTYSVKCVFYELL